MFAVFVMVLVIMIVMMIFVIMIMAVASLTVLMVVVLVVMVFVIMLVIVVMVVLVAAGALVLIHVEVDAAILHRMHHGVLQLALVHIHHGGHEVEIRLLGGFQMIVVLNTYLQVGEVQSDPFAIDGD